MVFLGNSQSVLVCPRKWMLMEKLLQPKQISLKEVGSRNVGAPAHQSMHACVPPYPSGDELGVNP